MYASKQFVVAILLLAACVSAFSFAKKDLSKRDDTVVCENFSFTCSSVGGKCSPSCNECGNVQTNCSSTATTPAQVCACISAYVDCLAATKDAACDSAMAHDDCLSSYPTCGCGTPYTGQLTIFECQSNAYCDNDESVCKALKGVGADCEDSGECGSSTANPLWTYEYACVSGKCQIAYKSFPGDSCTTSTDCEFNADFGLGCVNGKCASQVVGGECPATQGMFETMCGAKLYCEEDNTCQAISAIGASCNSNSTDIAHYSCGLTAVCGFNSVCVPYVSKAQGASCEYSEECQPNLYCSESSKTCKAKLSNVACSNSTQCFNINSDYAGCECDGSKAVCANPGDFVPETECSETAIALRKCVENNGCLYDATQPGGCVESNCKEAADCFTKCYIDYMSETTNVADCAVNYVNTCPVPDSFAAKNGVAWAMLAGASAAVLL